MRKHILLPLSVLILASLACSINLPIPEVKVKTGPTVTEEVFIAQPDAKEVDLTLKFGIGELFLQPGAESGLIEGTATYNVTDFKPEVVAAGGIITLQQEGLKLDGLPSFTEKPKNTWELRLSDTPLTLRIQAGAYAGEYELGGLQIQNLYIEEGAATTKLSFSEPNQVEMGILDYQTGASNVELRKLANANFATLIFKSGAGNYTLDFSGELQRQATVKIESGLSNINIIIPDDIPAKVTVEGALSNLSTHGDWSQSGNTYTQPGEGPGLTITIEMGAGNLQLLHTSP